MKFQGPLGITEILVGWYPLHKELAISLELQCKRTSPIIFISELILKWLKYSAQIEAISEEGKVPSKSAPKGWVWGAISKVWKRWLSMFDLRNEGNLYNQNVEKLFFEPNSNHISWMKKRVTIFEYSYFFSSYTSQ